MAATALPTPAAHGLAGALRRARSEPAYGAFLILWVGFTVLPLVMGLDKFADVLTRWEGYLAPWVVGLLPFSAHTAMLMVGVVEIVAGVMVALRPGLAAYVVALWLGGIIVNLLTTRASTTWPCATSASSSRPWPWPSSPGSTARHGAPRTAPRADRGRIDGNPACPGGSRPTDGTSTSPLRRRAAADFLDALGVCPLDAEGLQESPGRMARAYAELLTPGCSS